MAAQVEIVAEREEPAGWRFDVQAIDDAGALRRCSMTLSWADYDLWCGGADEPARVAEAVVRFVLGRGGELRDRFDASLVRRLYEGADGVIPGLIA